MSTVLMRLPAGVLLLALLAGCSALEGIRRPPEPSPAPSATPAVRLPHQPAEFTPVIASVDVPAGYREQVVRFRTADVGVALFTKCEVPTRRVGNHSDCTARLLATGDGGQSWQVRRHPKPVADGHQVYFSATNELVLLAEPRLWYVSKDFGRSFTEVPVAPPMGGREVRATLPGTVTSVVRRPGGDLWAASVEQGRVLTASSSDRGRTWTSVELPSRLTDRDHVRLLTSVDGADLWLIAQPANRREFPEIWRLDDNRAWLPVPAGGHPPSFVAAAPVGHGFLLVSTADGTATVSGDNPWLPLPYPAGGTVETLLDGSVQARDDVDGSLWLGTGDGPDRNWIKVELQPGG